MGFGAKSGFDLIKDEKITDYIFEKCKKTNKPKQS